MIKANIKRAMDNGVLLSYQAHPSMDQTQGVPVKVIKEIGTGRWLVLDLQGISSSEELPLLERAKRQKKVTSHQLKCEWGDVLKLKAAEQANSQRLEKLELQMLEIKDLLEDLFLTEVYVRSPNIVIPIVDDLKTSHLIHTLRKMRAESNESKG